MHQWQLTVHRDRNEPQVGLRHASGFCRYWSGETARRLCQGLGLRTGEGPCPKACVWRLFLLARFLDSHNGESHMLQRNDYMPATTAQTPADDQHWNRKLRDHGLLPTRPRRMIARHILGRARHFSAETLIQELREDGCRCARATVYNTLNEFAEQGLLRALHVDAGPVIYDTVTSPHAHLYNVDTGELTDLAANREWLRALPELSGDMELESVQLIFRVRDRGDEAGRLNS